MKRIALILIVLLVGLTAYAQTAAKVAAYYSNDPAWTTAKTLAVTKSCTTSYLTWAWAGTMSSQIFVGGKAGDSVAIETKFKQSNYNAVSAWKVNADSILGVDSIIGSGFGKIFDFSNKVDGTLGGVLIFTNKSWVTADSGKNVQAYPILTPAK